MLEGKSRAFSLPLVWPWLTLAGLPEAAWLESREFRGTVVTCFLWVCSGTEFLH